MKTPVFKQCRSEHPIANPKVFGLIPRLDSYGGMNYDEEYF